MYEDFLFSKLQPVFVISCLYNHLNVFDGEGNGTPLQYSCLENPMDGGPWRAAVHGVVKSRTRLSDFAFTFHFHALEKEMATHASVLAWRVPGTVEPGGLLFMGSHRVGQDWSDLVQHLWGNISLWFWFAFPRWIVISTFSYTRLSLVCLLRENVYSVLLPVF